MYLITLRIYVDKEPKEVIDAVREIKEFLKEAYNPEDFVLWCEVDENGKVKENASPKARP